MSVFINGECWTYECHNKQPISSNFCSRCRAFGIVKGRPTPSKLLEHIKKKEADLER